MKIFFFNKPVYDFLKAVIIEGLLIRNTDLWSDHASNHIPADRILTIHTWQDLAAFDAVMWGDEESFYKALIILVMEVFNL